MRKILSTLMASILAAVPVQTADNTEVSDVNKITVSKEITESDITSGNTIIPSGATAFTVNIEQNQGFCLFEFDLNIGSGYEIITDSENRPVFSKCQYVNYHSMITGAKSDDTVVFTGTFSDDCTIDGGILTFYATETGGSDNKDYSVKSQKLYGSRWREYDSGSAYLSAGCPLKSYNDEIPSENTVYDSVYTVGDFNGDMEINLIDAFIAEHIVYAGGSPTNYQYENFKWLYDLLAPDIADVRAAFIWNDYSDSNSEMKPFSSQTALELFKYCADKSVGKTFVEDSYIGMICHS